MTVRTNDPAWMQQEQQAEEGLRAFMREHRAHNRAQGCQIERHHGRQTGLCAPCDLMYVGPSYIYLNRGARLTGAALRIRDLGEEAEPTDAAHRFGWEAADGGKIGVPARDKQLEPLLRVASGHEQFMALLRAWINGFSDRMEPERTLTGQRVIGAPV